MSQDIHFKGEFPSIPDAWKVFPNGGGFGDYIVVDGERIDWHEYTHSWGEQVEKEGAVRPAEIIDHSVVVLGKGVFKDGVEAGDYIPGTSGASIDEDGNADFRTVSLDQLRVKYNGDYLSLDEYIKRFKTELPPDWSEYTEAPLFNDMRLLVFDPASGEKYYTTIKALKDVIGGGGGNSGGGGGNITLIRSDDEQTTPTDNNAFTSLRTLLEIRKEVAKLDGKYLSKISPDTADGLITFGRGLVSKEVAKLEKGFDTNGYGVDQGGDARLNKGVFVGGAQFGENFIPGLTGSGGKVDADGNAEFDSLALRKWLEVPELRYNRVEVTVGDKWSAPGAGIIESVDTENQVVTLKLEEGEAGTFKYDDICMGIYHSSAPEENATSDYDDSRGNRRFAGFATCYFRVIQVMDSRCKRFRYSLRPLSANYPKQFHPCEFMTATAYGNFTDADRQTSRYETRTYQRYLRGVRDWEFTASNVAAQFGDLSNMSVHGYDLKGYSAYLNNVYFTGVIQQLSEQIQEALDKQQVGGKNLLREYDFRFGGKYWGGVSEGLIEVDLTAIQNQPVLSVSPSSVAWVYPEHEADLNVESNTNWNVL